MIGEGTIQFRSHDGCITTLQDFRHVPESGYNLISLGALLGEGFSFNFEGDLMEVSKEAHVKFRPNVSAMCICCKIQNLSWWIAIILGFESGGCETIGD